jgi:hypothetical protein
LGKVDVVELEERWEEEEEEEEILMGFRVRVKCRCVLLLHLDWSFVRQQSTLNPSRQALFGHVFHIHVSNTCLHLQ